MTLLYLLPHFDYSAAGRQVSLLAPLLHDVHVAALAANGPIADMLSAAGVSVHALGDGPAGWWRLRRLVGNLIPDVIHAWRLPAIRAAGALAMMRRRFRFLVSEPLRGGRWNSFDRRLVQKADGIVTQFSADTAALRHFGVSPDRIHELSPAVAPLVGEPPPLDVELPSDAYIIMCAGRLTPDHGFRDAILSTDVLQHTIKRAHILFAGDGPERKKMDRFVRGINEDSHYIRYLGARPNAAALLARADVVWVPGRGSSGRQVLLEAMAAGRPVIATARRELDDVLMDGVNGQFAPARNPPEVARQTRRLIDDPTQAARLGSAARDAVTGFVPERVAPDYAALYSR